MLRHAAFGLSLVVLTACGQQQTSSLNAVTSSPQPMFVLMGGYTTCDQHFTDDAAAAKPATVAEAPDPHRVFMLPKFNELLAKAPEHFGVAPRFVVSCYSEQNDSIYYFTSDAPDEIKAGERPDFIATIESMLTPDAPIYLIGHSHGGWLSLKTDSDLAQGHEIKALFSIDPISRVGCTTSIFSNCMSAPRDVSTEERQLIKSKTESWTNFYQTQTFYLHSSAIDQATRNLKVGAPHTEIQLTDDVWNEINDVVYR